MNSPPSPGSDSAPKSVFGVSHRVFHSRLWTHLFSRSFPP